MVAFGLVFSSPFAMKVALILSVLLCCSGSLNFGLAASTKESNGVVFCYYGEWSNGRPSVGRFGVSDIPPDLCTHVIYSFIVLDGPTGNLTYPVETTNEGKSNSVADLMALKQSNPDLKIMAAVGGWVEGSDNFSPVVNNDTLRANFVRNLYDYIDQNGFDGLDLDWEYPAQRGGLESDKEQFVVLVKELKELFAPKGYLLTAAVPVTQEHIDLSYNVPELNEHLDYIGLMTYDYYGIFENTTGANAPLYPQLTDAPDRDFNVNQSVHVWIENGGTPSKLILGLGAYGKSFTLASLNNTSTGAPYNGTGEAGPYTEESGILAYYEICLDQQNNTSEWTITEVDGNYVYASKGLFWIGYDNPNTIFAKAQYARRLGLGGIMYWAIDLDDFQGLCGEKFPLITHGIDGYASSTSTASLAKLLLLISLFTGLRLRF